MSNDARFIRPETVLIGDLIRVVGEPVDGVTTARVGRVHKRDYQGSDRVLFTEEGGEILRWSPYRANARVTLLERARQPEVPLTGFAKMMDEVKERTK